MGRDAGITADMLSQLHLYATSDAFSPEEKLVLTLTDALCSTPAAVDADLFVRLHAAFSDAQLVELSSAIAWENYRARFNRVFDVEAEDYSHGAFCPLPVRDA